MDINVLDEINQVRTSLINKGWIGVLQNSIGFGNISVRNKTLSNQFIITGSATGGVSTLKNSHLALVEHYNIAENQLWCKGETIGSSESLTHAAIYSSNPEVNAVIHIHSRQLWTKYLNKLPTSDENAEYGTPEMAISIQKIMDGKYEGLVIMGGHEDGIIAFAKNLKNTLELLNSLDE